ncbi:MAG TPA: hypothetical protein VF796_11220, partial [Humisphaera sp.]
RAAHAAALLGTALMVVSMFLGLLIAAAMGGAGVPVGLVAVTVGCVIVALAVAFLACELDPYRPLVLVALTAVAGLVTACGLLLLFVGLVLQPTLRDVPFGTAAAAVAGLVLAGFGGATVALCVRAALAVRSDATAGQGSAFEPVMPAARAGAESGSSAASADAERRAP